MEMKNICGKIPKDLHEKVREEIGMLIPNSKTGSRRVRNQHTKIP